MTTSDDQIQDHADDARAPGPATGQLPPGAGSAGGDAAGGDALVEGDLLVEDVSIDGMCGVY